MNVNDGFLFQMYQMNSQLSFLESGAFNASGESDKTSFQDLMKQASNEVSKPSSKQKEDPATSSAPQKKPDDAPSKDMEPEEDTTVLEQAAALLYRPEIQMLVTDPATTEPAGGAVFSVSQTDGEAVISAFTNGMMEEVPTDGSADVLADDMLLHTDASLAPNTSEFDVVLSSPQTAEDMVEQDLTQDASVFDMESESNLLDGSSEVVHMEQPLFRDLEQAPIPVGKSYNMDTTAPDMDKTLADSIQTAVQEGAQKLEIRLTPEHLGTVTVELTLSKDGSLQVVLHASNAKSADLLSDHLHTLNLALQNLNSNPVRVEVERNQDSSAAQQQSQQQADPDGHGQQQQQQQQQRESRQVTEDFLQQLRLGLFPLDESI